LGLFNLRASSRAGIDDERAACIVSVGWSAFHHVVEQSDNLRGERGFNHFLEDIVCGIDFCLPDALRNNM